MGRIDKGVTCSIPDCTNTASRSVSGVRLESANLGVRGVRHAYLCEQHYKELKKKTRNQRQIEKWRWDE